MVHATSTHAIVPCEDSGLLEVITFPKGTQEYRFTIGLYHFGDVHLQVCHSF